jgi:hypothetical protein
MGIIQNTFQQYDNIYHNTIVIQIHIFISKRPVGTELQPTGV